jgi:NitT/TauT family transport system ATP-binding protein
LSLGLARRAALARAFAVDPDFLILDEPLASLDDALAARLREEIATLVGRRAVTTILVTHNLDDAIRLGDRLFLLSARPARILHIATIHTPRAARSETEISDIKANLARLNLAND